jgi:hypothetical protein
MSTVVTVVLPPIWRCPHRHITTLRITLIHLE